MSENEKKKVGIPSGFKYPRTIRKRAIKRLESIVMDDNAPPLAQAIAATSLLSEIPK